jgi:hypothetical protein
MVDPVYNPLDDPKLIATCRYLLANEPQSNFVRDAYPMIYELLRESNK